MATIRLTTCDNAVEANMLKDLLTNEGIACFLTNENFTSLMPNYSGMMGAGIQIMVDEKDAEKASGFLAVQNGETELKCPNCHSDKVTFGLGLNRFKKIFFILLSALTFTPLSNLTNTFYCKECKTEFKK
jgi:hypothetical protein